MEASKPTTAMTTAPAPVTAEAPAPATAPMTDADTAAAGGEKKKGGKKAKTGKTGDKPKGARGVPKNKGGPKTTKTKVVFTETELCQGISKPATRRLFKQVPGNDNLRLADNATDGIRELIAVTTKRVAYALAESVDACKRQTAYLSDASSCVQKLLPSSSVFG